VKQGEISTIYGEIGMFSKIIANLPVTKEVLENSLYFLSKLLDDHFNKDKSIPDRRRVIILIDEYDHLINTYYDHPEVVD